MCKGRTNYCCLKSPDVRLLRPDFSRENVLIADDGKFRRYAPFALSPVRCAYLGCNTENVSQGLIRTIHTKYTESKESSDKSKFVLTSCSCCCEKCDQLLSVSTSYRCEPSKWYRGSDPPEGAVMRCSRVENMDNTTPLSMETVMVREYIARR